MSLKWKILKKYFFLFEVLKNVVSLQSQNNGGTIAQLVEQWTENPCVASSNLAGTTKKPTFQSAFFYFLFYIYSLRVTK